MQYIIFVFIIAFLILLSVRKIYKLFLLKVLMKSLGQSINQESYSELNDEYLHYCEDGERYQSLIEDLQLDEIFNFLNRTYTDVGREYMFAQMFISHHRHDLMEYVIRKLENEKILSKTVYELYDLSKKYSESLSLFDDIPSFSHFRLVPLFLSMLCPFAMMIAYFCFQIEVVQFIFIWLALHVTLNMYYAQSTHENLSQVLSCCYVVISLKNLNDFQLFPDKETQEIKKMTTYALRYMTIQRFYDMLSQYDVFLLVELFKNILCVPILQYSVLCKHLKQLKKDYIKIYEYVGIVDMSLAMMSVRKEYKTCIPQVSHRVEITFQDCYHPLIDDCIKNSFSTQQSCIITGSNASGKSTFLKMIGLNIVLAKAYHTCFADSFIYYPFHIYTSIHMKDDLRSGDSYYVKEIKVLKQILDAVQHQVCFVLIDEILRGTNEKERVAIAKVILKELFESSSLIFVTTHDLSLAHFFNDIQKYCFNDYVKENQLFCDYKIKAGICSMGNAVLLLKIYGYNQQITEQLENIL